MYVVSLNAFGNVVGWHNGLRLKKKNFGTVTRPLFVFNSIDVWRIRNVLPASLSLSLAVSCVKNEETFSAPACVQCDKHLSRCGWYKLKRHKVSRIPLPDLYSRFSSDILFVTRFCSSELKLSRTKSVVPRARCICSSVCLDVICWRKKLDCWV